MSDTGHKEENGREPDLNNGEIYEQVCWSTDLSAQLKKQLLNISKTINTFNSDERQRSDIAHQGISYIVAGTTTICMQTPSLKTINNIVMGKGDWFGNYELESSTYAPFFLTEVEPVTLIHFPHSDMKRLLQDNIEMFKWFHSLSFAAKSKWLQAQLISHENIQIRVIYLLIELVAHLKFIRGQVPRITMSQLQISRITGIGRQRVNAVIKSLEKENLLYLERGCIHITNITSLGQKLDNVDLSIRDPRVIT